MTFRIDKPLARLTAEDERVLLDRSTSADDTVRERTAAILRRVRTEGDAALRAMAREFDRVTLEALEVPKAACVRALDRLDPALRRALERSARNVATAHRAFLPQATEVETEPGILVGRRPDPLARVTEIVPGLNGPTVIDIMNGGSFVAVHAVVPADSIYRVIAALKQVGAEGILVSRIERLMP